MLSRIVVGMNQINRLEETWTPQWDLGLQDSFGFMEKQSEPTEKVSASLNGMSSATSEVFNRQPIGNRRIDAGANSIGALIAYFEMNYSAEEGTGE